MKGELTNNRVAKNLLRELTRKMPTNRRHRYQDLRASSTWSDKTNETIPIPTTSRREMIRNDTCYRCGNKGHRARDCNRQRKIDPEDDSELEEWEVVEISSKTQQEFRQRLNELRIGDAENALRNAHKRGAQVFAQKRLDLARRQYDTDQRPTIQVKQRGPMGKLIGEHRQQRHKRHQEQRNDETDERILEAWKDYVYSERTQNGMYEQLMNNGDECY